MLNANHDYRHLYSMTDNTGMLQFSRHSRPDPSSGYTLDDNARALLVAMQMPGDAHQLCALYLAYLRRSRQPDGTWSNLLLHDQYRSDFDSQDSLGRLALSFSVLSRSSCPEMRQQGAELLKAALPLISQLSSPRSQAYALLALVHGHHGFLPYEDRLLLISRFSSSLLRLYWRCHGSGWYWFEDGIYYCNGILPQSLFAAYGVTGDPSCLHTATESLDFLNGILFRQGYLNVIGNQGWYLRHAEPALFDQQPVDAASICFANLQAWRLTENPAYRQLAEQAARWYDGDNYHGLSMVDADSGGCYDALTEYGTNSNQGAEALLSLLLTRQAMQLLADHGRPASEQDWDQLCGLST